MRVSTFRKRSPVLSEYHQEIECRSDMREVDGIRQYENKVSLKSSVSFPTLEDDLVVAMVDVHMQGALSKMADAFDFREMEIVTVRRIAYPP